MVGGLCFFAQIPFLFLLLLFTLLALGQVVNLLEEILLVRLGDLHIQCTSLESCDHYYKYHLPLALLLLLF